MSNIDKQIANMLDRIHRELYGGRMSPCRWYYNGTKDVYHCPHTAVFGKEVFTRLPNPFIVDHNPALDVVHEDHTL